MGIYDIDSSVANNEALGEFKAMLLNFGNYGNTEEYRKIFNKFSDAESRFEGTLTHTQISDYAEIIELANDMEVQDGNENFILGFKAAFRLFIDCLR